MRRAHVEVRKQRNPQTCERGRPGRKLELSCWGSHQNPQTIAVSVDSSKKMPKREGRRKNNEGSNPRT